MLDFGGILGGSAISFRFSEKLDDFLKFSYGKGVHVTCNDVGLFHNYMHNSKSDGGGTNLSQCGHSLLGPEGSVRFVLDPFA